MIRADSELWIRASRLTGAGLTEVHGAQREFNGEIYTALSSLAPGVAFTLDEDALELRLTAAPDMFASTRVVLQNNRPPNIEYGRASGFFLNYDVLAQQRTQTSVTLDAGLSINKALVETTYTRTPDDVIIRGLSSLTIDAPARMVRFVAGDTIARPTLLGSLPTVGGVSLGREFSLDPYRLPYPLPGVAGSVSTQATADIYVNGTLVRRETLPPGAFSLQRLPVVGGLGNVQVVVRDRLGREQVFGGPYYFTSTVLDKGTNDFQYLIGERREDQTDANPTYGPLTASVQHRVGVTSWLTLGARAEGKPNLVSGGPTMNLRIGRLGEMQAEGAVSEAQGIVDYAAAGNYSFITRYFNVSATATWLRPHFATLDLAPDDPRNELRANGTASVSLGRVGVTAFYSNNTVAPPATVQPAAVPVVFSEAQTTDSPAPIAATPEERAGLAVYLQFGTRVQMTVSAARVHSEQATKGWDGFASLNILMGPRAVASVGVNQNGDGTTRGVVSLQKSLPLGTGIGYRVEAQSASDGTQT
ncbi:MAG TPA: fimbria/pilus outer membrane usher protein [Gemmatimonadaceae bacterium]